MKKILVADDQFAVAKGLRELLTSAGYEVFLASDGEMAIDIAIKETPNLIIMDVLMPKKSGIEAVKLIRVNENLKEVHIIFISAKGQFNDEKKAMEAGGDSFIYKPFSPKKMLQEINSILS